MFFEKKNFFFEGSISVPKRENNSTNLTEHASAIFHSWSGLFVSLLSNVS